jgi:hypothetical protein
MVSEAVSEGTCARCGAALVPASGYLTQLGTVCGACFSRQQDEARRADIASESLDASLSRRAWELGGLHAMWGVAAIVAADWAHLPRWLSSLLIVAALILAYGLRLRWRSALATAMALDVAGVLACLAWGVVSALRGESPVVALLAVFPLLLVGFTRWLRKGFVEEDPDGLRRYGVLSRWLAPVAAIAAVCGIGVHFALRPRVDPARELMRTELPTWESVRARSDAGGPQLAALLARARPWPALAAPLEALDRAWPDEAAMRDASRSLNLALGGAGLPFFTDVWRVGEQPIVLTYQLAARVPWRIGARTVEVMRLRRLDTLNVEFGLLGSTEHGQPVALLDRVEAELAMDLPAMYGKAARPGAVRLNDFDRLAFAKSRAFYEARLGAGLAGAAAALGERDRALEEMRSRLHGGQVQLFQPDGFVLGAEWLATLEPLAQLGHEGGPLILDTDLDRVATADEKLRDAETTRLFAAAVDLSATGTEAHEARHAVDGGERTAPPPPALFAVMEDSSTSMIALADGELRAFLGEIHDAPAPACVSLALVLRNAFGAGARATPHFYAAQALATALDATPDAAPSARLTLLCALPDGDLRARVASAWQKLYAEPMSPATRLAAGP